MPGATRARHFFIIIFKWARVIITYAKHFDTIIKPFLNFFHLLFLYHYKNKYICKLVQ